MSNRLKMYTDYIRNTGREYLPIAMFDEDWDPVGPSVRRDLKAAEYILEWADGTISLTGSAP